MNILRAIEKLSAASDNKKSADNAAEEKQEAPVQNTENDKKQTRQENLRLTENLLARHEHSVYRIKNGKK